MNDDLIYFGCLDDIPIFIDSSIKKGEGYIVDLGVFFYEGKKYLTDNGVVGLINF